MPDEPTGDGITGDPLTEQFEMPVVPDDAYFAALSNADNDEAWPTRAARRGVSMRVPTIILLALLLAAGAFWGGAAVQRNQSSGSAAGGFAAIAARFGGAAGASGKRSGASSFFGGSASSPTATGTVTAIEGSTMYLTESGGQIVEVVLSHATTITRNANATASSLQPGDTAIVEGTKAKSGVVTATSVAATAKGVTASVGGFGAFGGSSESSSQGSGG